MKSFFEVVGALSQFFIGILILVNHADIRTLAWYYVLCGSITVLALLFVGLITVLRGEK